MNFDIGFRKAKRRPELPPPSFLCANEVNLKRAIGANEVNLKRAIGANEVNLKRAIGANGASPKRAVQSQFWSMPKPYMGSVTLSRIIFLLSRHHRAGLSREPLFGERMTARDPVIHEAFGRGARSHGWPGQARP
jgi:hypothetical protein